VVKGKARMRLAIILLTTALGVLALAQANSQNSSSPNLHQSTTRQVSPATPPTGAYFDHVVTILMENEGVFDICKSSPPPCLTSGPAPYMAGLANATTIAAQYLALISTSQPNYVALISGSMQGCTSSGCPSPITAPNLVDRFEASGLTWKGYFENQTLSRGCDFSSPEPYTPIHNPFIVFQDITNNTARCNKLVDANPNSCGSVIDCALVNDLNNATAAAPNFMWLTPNDCDDMRGNSVCGTSSLIGPGDTYLSKLVPSILNSRTFTTSRSALFITFDEGNSFCPGPFPSSENCVYASWSGPVAKTHFGSGLFYNHYSYTKTIETNWNLAGFTSNDKNANPMAEFFNNQNPDFTLTANPASLTIPVGSRANSTITLASINNFTGTVSLTASSSPAGPSLTLSPASIPLTAHGTGTSTLTFSSATIGNYTVTVIGTASPLSHNTTITYNVAAPDFVISANPSTMTIGQLSSVANTPVAVNSTGDRTFFESSYLAQSFSAKGLIWLFYEDSRFTCEGQTGCLTYTSSTNGSRWAPVTRVPVHITDSDFSVYTNGSSVFYARYNETSFESSCGKRIEFGLGALNTSGSITWQSEQTVAVGASNRDYPNDEITVDSNGQVWIAYMIDNHSVCGGNGTDRPQVIHSAGTNYAVWTGNFTLSTAHSNNWHIALASLGNGEIYASYWLRNIDLHGRLYNGTSWGADEQISSTTTKNDVNAWLFNTGTNVYALYFDNSTETFNYATRSSTGTWTINTIGFGESHTGTIAFSPSYYSLPDSASYDSRDNLFDLFYLNATAQRIDQWSGSGITWTKTTGLVSIAAAPYPDSISSFIQSSPNPIGSVFYISGSASPFTMTSASLSFRPAGNTGSFTTTVTGKNGFTSTVNLTTSISSATGLSVSCSPTSIIGGSGSSTCNLVSSARGNYTVTLTGTSGSLSHFTTVTVSVSAFPDFSILASSPAPSSIGQSPASIITVTALSGFTGIVALTDTVPTGLSCTAISPTSITSSGTATVSCTAIVAGNYTLTLTGTSGSLNHSTTALFRFQDFTTSATSPAPVNAAQSAISTITITALNHFNGTVNLSETVPSGLVCGAITPASLTGSGSATVSCSANVAGNYTLTITATAGSLVHSATALFQIRDFAVSSTSPAAADVGVSTTSTITVTGLNHFSATVSFSDGVPSGLTCGAISPPSVTGSGSATVSCHATVAGNYTLTLTGTSGSLTHSSTAIFQFWDFSVSASTAAPANAGTSSNSTISILAVNHFNGVVSLTDTVPLGLVCGSINPASVTGSGIATVSCSAVVAGNYTLTVTGSSSSLVRNATILFQFRDYAIFASILVPTNAGSPASSTITITSMNHFAGNVSLTDTLPSGLACGVISPTSISGSGTATVSCSSSNAGNYTLTVTGTSGSLSHSATTLFRVQDFNVSASSPAAVSVGVSATPAITITAVNGFAVLVSLSDNIPTGLTCAAINPGSVTGSGTALVSCTSNVAGNYTLTITGANSALSHSITVILQFQDYTIIANPSAVQVNSGSAGSSTITITPLNHFSGTISLSSSASTGATTMINTTSLLGGSGTSTLTFSANAAGNYTVTVNSSSGTLTHTTTVIVQVVDFSIAASPSITTILAGGTGNSTITINGLNGFSGTISLILTPSMGLTATIAPNSITGSGSSTMSVTSSTSGDYSVSIKATSGMLSHTIGVIVHVLDYSLTGNPTNLIAPIGSSTSSTLTLQSLNGYSGNVTLTFTVQSACTSTGATGFGGGRPPFILAPPAVLPSVSISPQTFQLSAGGTQQALVSVSLPSDLLACNYPITILTSDGRVSHQVVLTVVATDFSMTATPNSLTLQPGANATIVLRLGSLNFFQGNVTLTITSQAGGPTGTLSSSIVQVSPFSNVNLNLTIRVPTNTALGNYTITIQATSGGLSHILTIPVRVTATGFVTVLATILNPQNASPISATAIVALLTIFATLKVRGYQSQNRDIRQRNRIEHRIHRRSTARQFLPYSSGLPVLWVLTSRNGSLASDPIHES